MPRQKKLKEIIRTLLGSTLLRSILIVCLAVTILLPTYSTFYIMPHFVALLIQNIESDAQRTARHLASSLPLTTAPLSRQFITEEFLGNLHRAITDFEIADMRILSDKGEVIYSTRAVEIGTLNTHPYFWDTVAKGKIFSKVLSREQLSAEGNVLTSDVAEIYAPLMAGSSFRGAFEIYFDVTKRKNSLDRLLFRSTLVLYSIAFLVLALSGIALWKASSAIIQRNLAEMKLQEANQFLETRVAEQTHEILVTQRISIEALASLAEFYDIETGEHLQRIQEYTELLVSALRENPAFSARIGSRPGFVEDMKLASLLHDIGKTAIPKDILLKDEKLTPEEFEMLKQHTVIAGDVLLRANSVFMESFNKDSYLALAGDIAANHHERWDGNGYPHGIKGEEIPLAARIIALVDVYDALRSSRSYKEAWSHEETVAEIARERGKQFDPLIVDAFLAIEKKFQTLSSRSSGREELRSLAGGGYSA